MTKVNKQTDLDYLSVVIWQITHIRIDFFIFAILNILTPQDLKVIDV